MLGAIQLAEEAYEAGEVPIGCVITDPTNDDAILATGRNRTNETCNATRHAEFEALEQLWKQRDKVPVTEWPRLRLYVTVEPCVMCAAALRMVGLLDVHYAAANDRFGGCGSVMDAHKGDYLAPGIGPLMIVQENAYRNQCVLLLRKFYLRQNDRAPNPKKKTNRKLKQDDLI